METIINMSGKWTTLCLVILGLVSFFVLLMGFQAGLVSLAAPLVCIVLAIVLEERRRKRQNKGQ
ncbi:hypothetical protein [Paenibacillus larvae]|nr:hypothetical protein [Paenibacillus larvae]MCY9752266.1 hypothetical protein [Paenibacillus larvae]MDR5605495.1 hypothetical protein [Paenibacillus larvae]